MKNSLTTYIAGLAVGVCLAQTASAQIVIGSTTTAFTDISVSGTALAGISDDSEINISSATLSGAGWAGNQLLPLANIRVGNNGCVLWSNAASEVGYVNSTTLPTMTAANTTDFGNGGLTAGTTLVCPLWDDNFPGTGASCRWQVIGGNLIIQWTNEDHFNAQGTGTVTYQMIAYGGATIASGAPLVDFVYNDTLYAASQFQNDGGSATIGFKNWGGTIVGANDVEFGVGGGNNTINDPAFGDPLMKPKVGGYVANNDPTLPKAVRIKGAGAPVVVFCSGDAVGTTCLGCGTNNGAVGAGCGNSSFATGAVLSASGSASVGTDTLVLTCSNMTGPGLFFQYNAIVVNPSFGDGMLCAGAGIIRMGVVFPGPPSPANTASYPGGLTPAPISIAGAPIAAGDLKHYQCWYRDSGESSPGVSFCTPATFNTSNGVSITWAP